MGLKHASFEPIASYLALMKTGSHKRVVDLRLERTEMQSKYWAIQPLVVCCYLTYVGRQSRHFIRAKSYVD